MSPEASVVAWYQSGNWPLVGAIATLFVTVIAGFIAVILQSSRAHHNDLKKLKIDILHRRLHEFYDPIYAHLLMNARTFSETGPNSFPTEHVRREAAAEVWNKIKSNVILPNNKKISDVITTKSHLIADDDDIVDYIQLLNHIAMYNVFQDTTTEIYSKFQYPKTSLRHVELHREAPISEIKMIMEQANR